MAKQRAKQIVADHILSNQNSDHEFIAINDTVSIITVPNQLKAQIAEVTGTNLLSNYDYLVLQRKNETITLLSQRIGKPKIIASNLSELRVSENGSGPKTLGKLIEEVAVRVPNRGKIDSRKIKTHVITRLERKLAGRTTNELVDLTTQTFDEIRGNSFRALETDLGIKLSEPLSDFLREKQETAKEKLEAFFDTSFGSKDMHPLIDFNDLPDQAIDTIAANIHDKNFVKETYVKYRLVQNIQETVVDDAMDYFERVGMSITGGEDASVDFFRQVFSEVYLSLEQEQNRKQLDQLVIQAPEGEAVSLDTGEANTLYIPPDLVKVLKGIKPELNTQENLSLVISQYIFRISMIKKGMDDTDDSRPAKFALNFSKLSKQIAESIRREKERDITIHGSARLGFVDVERKIRSTEGPFNRFPEVHIEYPSVVVNALGRLYAEYNHAFKPLVEANREWPTDYQYIHTADGTPINGWVQIDMNGLNANVLEKLAQMEEDDVVEYLRRQTFEIENSLAMYGLLSDIFSHGQDSAFKIRFRESLNEIRQKHNKKIAILGVTSQKYMAMRESEFGKRDGEILTESEIKDISGFDTLMGPEQFREYIQYLEDNNLESDYLFYVRASDPLEKLKDPTVQIEGSLLEDPKLRKFIKAHTITFNIDDPAWNPEDFRRINDTKGYLESMRMAHTINTYEEFVQYMEKEGLSKADITSGKAVLRVKPGVGSYGCYGHLISNEDDFFPLLRKGLEERGSYVIQPEIKTPLIFNESDGIWYTYIDRNFYSFVNGKPIFMSGFRFYLPADSKEATEGRIHGATDSVLGEIYSN